MIGFTMSKMSLLSRFLIPGEDKKTDLIEDVMVPSAALGRQHQGQWVSLTPAYVVTRGNQELGRISKVVRGRGFVFIVEPATGQPRAMECLSLTGAIEWLTHEAQTGG